MRIRVFRYDHPEVTEVIASEHCILRFRKRRRIRDAGLEAISAALHEAFEAADFTHWTPTWVSSERGAEMWALTDDVAFPLAPAGTPGSWLATTCLVRPRS